MGNHIATRVGGDRLYWDGSRVEGSVDVGYGHIVTADGARIEVPNIESLLAHGYWDEVTDTAN